MQESEPIHVSLALGVAFGLLFAIAFAAFWVLITIILAYFSGWVALAESFSAAQPPEGRKFQFASARMGRGLMPVSYKNCLSVVVSGKGLFLSLWPIFRGFKAPDLLIPWAAVESVEDRKMFFVTYQVVRLARYHTAISFYGELGREVRRVWSAQR